MSNSQFELECMLIEQGRTAKAMQLSLLEEITNGFSDEMEIGRGGFAVVYKGILHNGDVVAVKRLSNTYMYEKEFQRELLCLMKIKHKNIVRFLGYCADTQGNMEVYNGKFVMADVQQRLLCFEYLPNGSLDNYIEDASNGFEWRTRYNIIKGICEGLLYLHQNNIMHLDLKPSNILLDHHMMPKITDFGISRCFEEDQTRVIATQVRGTMGYMAPEFTSREITHKFDLYSLGVIIMEVLTGKKGYQAVENVLESWKERLEISERNTQWEQIRVCAEIGVECAEFDPVKRPHSMKHITDRLAETESVPVIPACVQKELLGVYPFALCFPFEANKSIPCSLQLTNNTDDHVAFVLMNNRKTSDSFIKLPQNGFIPPRSPYTLVVRTKREKDLPQKRNIDMILLSTRLGPEHIETFQSQCNNFFQEAKENGNTVQEVTMKAVYTRKEMMASYKPISPEIKILNSTGDWNSRDQYPFYRNMDYQRCPSSLDTNQENQWIAVGEDYGHVLIWNHREQKKVASLKVSSTERVTSVKFIGRKKLFVAGTQAGHIHVYKCETIMQKIKSFRATHSSIYVDEGLNPNFSLAVHPTLPYLLSSHYHQMKLWDWDKDWKCLQTFVPELSGSSSLVVFSPKGIIASASEDNTVVVWSLDSPEAYHTFSGHSNKVNCLDFYTCDDQEYLVTSSNDKSVKIWDMEKKICLHTIETFGSPVMSILYHPNLRILMIGSEHGSVYFWNTATISREHSHAPRLERIINIGGGGVVIGLSYLMKRVVVATEEVVAVMDIENSIDDYGEPQLSGHHTTSPGDKQTCSKAGSSSELPILCVHPLELCFPCEPNELSTPCSLYLTNKTDKHVGFRLIDKSCEYWNSLVKLPLYGIVPPGSTYTLMVPRNGMTNLTQDRGTDLILQSSTSGDKYMFQSESRCDDFFDDAIEMGNAVHHVALEAIYISAPQGEMTSSEIISIKNSPDMLSCLDAHPTQPWIITGHERGIVRIWDYGSQSNPTVEEPQARAAGSRSWMHRIWPPLFSRKKEVLMEMFKVTENTGDIETTSHFEKRVSGIKFVARKKSIVVCTGWSYDGFVHVFKFFNCLTKVKKIACFSAEGFGQILAVHPIQPYVLSTHASGMNLWDGNKSWKCTKSFPTKDSILQIAFNPNNAMCFASASNYHRVEVWGLKSPRPNCTMYGHSDIVNCVDYFTRDDQKYLITGSDDCTARIWDLQEHCCIHTMEGIMSPVYCVISVPGRPYLVTGSLHGTVHVWRSTDFRLVRIVDLSGYGYVQGLVCLMGSRRIAIGQAMAVSIMEIEDEEEMTI